MGLVHHSLPPCQQVDFPLCRLRRFGKPKPHDRRGGLILFLKLAHFLLELMQFGHISTFLPIFKIFGIKKGQTRFSDLPQWRVSNYATLWSGFVVVWR